MATEIGLEAAGERLHCIPFEEYPLYENHFKKVESRAVFYKPWPRKSAVPGEYPLMSATYARLAKQYHADLANVGDVFEKYSAMYPGETMYANDGEHASPLTSNIAAYVILRTVTGKKPICVSADEKKIDAACDAFLSETK